MNEYMEYLAKIIPEKDSLKLVKNEAEKYYKSHSLDDCFNMGIELYHSDNFQIQEVGIFLLIFCTSQYLCTFLFERYC